MISYERDPKKTIHESSVKIIGLGGAGANMLDRSALDGITGAEMLAINTDMRALMSSIAGEKIQMGEALTRGLGSGGDPVIGLQAAQESEAQIREAIKGYEIIFLCVGLGGGTGSGAAPLISRIAREEDVFVVIFATMPFSFEGKRRQSQAEASLNELSVLANALITFDNGRMGELVLAKQGIHEAFAAADRMISESIKAVTRLVVRPGLINIGLDDLMTALRTTRSRCLFGSGIAKGENRSHLALENALSSPLLDKGGLLKDTSSVLIHICGGESLTLYETELLMQNLGKYIPENAHVLFGAAVDPSMGDSLSVTLISALPEDKLNKETKPLITKVTKTEVREPSPAPSPAPKEELEKKLEKEKPISEDLTKTIVPVEPLEVIPEEFTDSVIKKDEVSDDKKESTDTEVSTLAVTEETKVIDDEIEETALFTVVTDKVKDEVLAVPVEDEAPATSHIPEPKNRAEETTQPELELNGAPKGKFEGTTPNYLDGEDLDIPPFLRKKNR